MMKHSIKETTELKTIEVQVETYFALIDFNHKKIVLVNTAENRCGTFSFHDFDVQEGIDDVLAISKSVELDQDSPTARSELVRTIAQARIDSSRLAFFLQKFLTAFAKGAYLYS